MKKTVAKILSALLAIVIVLGVVSVMRTELHGAYTPTLYYNDRPWYISNRLPAENIHGTNYLPITLFLQLPSVDVRMNETLNTFIITHGDYYLSFDVNSNYAANHDKVRMYMATAEYHGERYVPAKIVCMYLELGYEEITSEETGETVIRISDENKKKPFEELVNRYYPDFIKKDTTIETTPPPPDTEDTEYQPPVLSEREIYIAVDLSDGRYADNILAVLKKYNYRATFFLGREILKNYTSLISKIAAHGHEIAIGANGTEWSGFSEASDIVRFIEERNYLLAKAVKRKSHIISLPIGGGVVMSRETETELENAGYFTWQGNIWIYGGTGVSAGVERAVKGIWNNRTVGIRLAEAKNTKAILEGVLKFISENSSVCEMRVVTPLFDGYSK